MAGEKTSARDIKSRIPADVLGVGDNDLTKGEQNFVDNGDHTGLGESTMQAGAGDDTLAAGGEGDDTLAAGGGEESLAAGGGQDTLAAGGEGDDEVLEVDVGEGKPKQKFVPHGAMHAERVKRQALEATLKDEATARKTAESRFEKLAERLLSQQPAPAAVPVAQPEVVIPSLETDPGGHVLGTMQVITQALGVLLQREAGRDEGYARASQISELGADAVAQEAAFIQQNPDYVEASNHMQKTREAELEAQGYTPAERRQMLSQLATHIAQRARATGKNPAEIVYGMSIAAGWKKGAPAAAAAAPVVPAVVPQLRLVKAAAGQDAGGPTIAKAGGEGPRPMTARRLLDMNDADFDKAMATPEGMAMLGR